MDGGPRQCWSVGKASDTVRVAERLFGLLETPCPVPTLLLSASPDSVRYILRVVETNEQRLPRQKSKVI